MKMITRQNWDSVEQSGVSLLLIDLQGGADKSLAPAYFPMS